MISDTITLIEFLRKHWVEYKIKSAMFNPQGQRVEGDEEIVLDKISVVSGDSRQWYYRVRPIEGYVFVFMPTVPGAVHVDLGKPVGADNPSTEYFRFVAHPLATFASGGTPNVLADFIIVGYRPTDLLKKAEC